MGDHNESAIQEEHHNHYPGERDDIAQYPCFNRNLSCHCGQVGEVCSMVQIGPPS